MKHNIVFKFIAIVLCAVSLLGILASAGSMLTLAELDLYNKTVDQVRDERILSDGESYAHHLALSYASKTLGGTPEELANDHYNHWFPYEYQSGKYGYALLDAEGNVLETYGTPTADAKTYTFTPIGQYMHVISKETESEKQARELEKTATFYQSTTDGTIVEVYDAIPQHGTTVNHVLFYEADGSVIHEHTDPAGLGFLYYNQDGNVVYRGFYSDEIEVPTPYVVCGVLFLDSTNSLVYEAARPEGVGYLTFNEYGNLVFEATAAEESIQTTPVYRAVLYGKDNSVSFSLSSEEAVGVFYYNAEGYAVFETRLLDNDTGISIDGNMQPGIVYGISLFDADGNNLYDIHSSSGIGATFYGNNGEFVYNSIYPEFSLTAESDTAVAAAPAQTDSATEPEETSAEETVEATEAPAETESSETTESAEADAQDVDETTAAEETEPTQENSSASDIPEDAEETAAAATEAAETVPETTEAPTEPPVTEAAETVPETAPEETVITEINGKSIDEYDQHLQSYYDNSLGEQVYVSYVYIPMPEYTVELYLAPDALSYEWEYDVLRIVRSFSSQLLPLLGLCILVFAVFGVYLCCAAGHRPKQEEIKAGGLNRLPLDLYACIVVGGIVLLVGLAGFLVEELVQKDFLVCLSLFAIACLTGCLLFVGFCFALVAQVKTPNGFLWRNTLTVRALSLCVRFGLWLGQFLTNKCFPWLGRMIKILWNYTVQFTVWTYKLLKQVCARLILELKRFFHWLSNHIHRFLSLLPLTWQWVLGGCVLVFISALFLSSHNGSTVILGLLLCFALILYAAHCFGILFESTKRMSKGDLDTKVDDKLMAGCFKDFAGDLNNLADVAVVAAQKQLKSERMKTELITNVSHDIKTPLTSIINYVDLLQKPHSDEEQAQYLEVLDRQSQRLKKLIDDLMDMSKASTGNMAVDITRVDAVESVNQALGEFADKLDRSQLYPVFRHTEDSVAMMADGKLVWRVLSNLLGNAVKYAMPGTRLYIDLMQVEGKVIISLKNISRDELNMDAEELMERFVRGDDSRNTEGSGLGLNIAKSLMELQKGQLQMLVDGDLFKVTLIFPGVSQ